MGANASSSLLAEMDAAKAKRQERLDAQEQQLRGGFRKLNDYTVEEEPTPNQTAPSVATAQMPQTETVEPKDTFDPEEYGEVIGKAPPKAESAAENPSDDEAMPGGSGDDQSLADFSWDWLPEFINDFQIMGGVAYYKWRVAATRFDARRDELKLLQSRKQATAEEKDELIDIYDKIEKISQFEREIVEVGKFTPEEKKQLGKALKAYFSAKGTTVSPAMVLALGFSKSMVRMGAKAEFAKMEIGN